MQYSSMAANEGRGGSREHVRTTESRNARHPRHRKKSHDPLPHAFRPGASHSRMRHGGAARAGLCERRGRRRRLHGFGRHAPQRRYRSGGHLHESRGTRAMHHRRGAGRQACPRREGDGEHAAGLPRHGRSRRQGGSDPDDRASTASFARSHGGEKVHRRGQARRDPGGSHTRDNGWPGERLDVRCQARRRRPAAQLHPSHRSAALLRRKRQAGDGGLQVRAAAYGRWCRRCGRRHPRVRERRDRRPVRKLDHGHHARKSRLSPVRKQGHGALDSAL